MNIRHNIMASFISQIYIVMVSVLVLPLYIKLMGAEIYGLVGFFATLQVFFNLIDIGLSQTIMRETAKFHGGSSDDLKYRQQFRALSVVFGIIAFVGGSFLLLSSNYITKHWLKVQTLPLDDVKYAVQVMAICVALRWVCGLYRGVVAGGERFVWLAWFNIFMITLRFVLVVPLMSYLVVSVRIFFLYQLIIVLIEASCLWIKVYQLLPKISDYAKLGWSLAPLRSLVQFTATIAFTTFVWALMTQADKLLLSNILPLDQYGYYTVAVSVASGILMISSPISNSILPRLVRLEAAGDNDGIINLYRHGTRLIVVLAGSAFVSLVCCTKTLLWAWMGDLLLASNVAHIVRLYAIGNVFLIFAAMPYYLQYAKGKLNLHVIGNIISLMALVPLICWSGTRYGASGAGYAWLVINALFFIIWVPIIHIKFVPSLHIKWLVYDIILPFSTMLLVGFVYMHMDIQFESRLLSFLSVLCFGSVCALISGLILGLIDIRSFFQRIKSVSLGPNY